MPLRDGTRPTLNAETVQVSLSAGGATHHHHHHHQQQQQQQQQNQNDVVHDGSTVASTTSTVATSPVIPPTLQFTRTLCHQQQHAPSIASSHRDLHPNPIQQHSNNSSSSSLSAKLFSIIKRDQPATAAQPITSTGGLQGKRQPEDFIFLAEFSQLYGPMVVRVVSSTRYMTLHNELARCIVPRIFTSDYLSAGCAIDDGVVASEEAGDFESIGRMVELTTESILVNHGIHCTAIHFNMFDVDGRGMIRRFALVYCTTDWEKLANDCSTEPAEIQNSISQDMEAILCRLVASNGRLFMMELARHLADLLQTIGSRNEQQQQQQRWLERDRERIDFAWQALLQFRSSYCRFLRRNESDAIVSDGLASSSGVVADALMQRIIDTSANDAAEFIGKLEWKYEAKPLASVHDSQNIDLLLRPASELLAHPLDLDNALADLNDLRQRYARPSVVLQSERWERNNLQPVASILAAGNTLVTNLSRFNPPQQQEREEQIDFTIGLSCNLETAQNIVHSSSISTIPVVFGSFNSPLCVPEHNPAIQSTADNIWFNCAQKLGYRCLSRVLLKYSFAKHLIFSLLRGHTLLILASPGREKSVANLVETLMIFIVGSSPPPCLKWSTGRALRSGQLLDYRIIGQDRRFASGIRPQSLPQGVVLLDYDQEVFYGERYRGNYLERLEEQAKQCYDEPTFLATLHLMFSLIAQQASLYYNLLTRPSFDLDDPIPQQVPIANDINSNGNKEKATRINPASYATIHGDIRLQDEGQQQHRSNNQHIFRRRKSLSSLRNSRQQQQQEIATFLTTDDSSTVTQQRSAPPSITRRTVMDLFGYSDFATTKPTSGTLLMQADATDSLQRRRDRTQSNTMADTAPRQRKQESSERRPRLLSSPLILFSTNDDNTVADYDGVDGGKWAEYQRKIWAILQCYGSDQEIVKHFAETVGRQQHPQSQQQPMEEGDAVLVVT